MIISLSITAEQTKKESQTVRLKGENLEQFPIAFVGRDSYIVSLQNENGINFNQDYVYNLHVGNYCAIAHEVKTVIDINHEYTAVSTGNLSLPQGITVPRHLKRKGQIIIQNDVWIGRGATLMGGITIHNGAVVAANAVVTKDVPPFSIVGGNPASVIKYRFDQGTIDKLLEIQWWNWTLQKINDNASWFTQSPDVFAEHFYVQSNSVRGEALEFQKMPIQFLCFEDDIEKNYAVWPKILKEFCSKFQHRKDCGLVIFISKEKQNLLLYEKILEMVEPIEAECSIYIYLGTRKEEKAIFRYVDYFITSRNENTVYHTCIADYENIPILSGVDMPIFDGGNISPQNNI